MTTNPWPALPLAEWKDTYATLHMWTQIVGKIRLALTPLVNHWWNTTLYVTPRGLTTTAMPYNGRQLQIDFDFIDHKLLIETTDGSTKTAALRPCSVAEFYQETMAALTTPFNRLRHSTIRGWQFLLPYNMVRTAKSPDAVLLSFLQSTYEAEAMSAKWDRHALERH